MDNKTYLRIKAKDIRKTLDICKVSERVVMLIRENEVYKNSKNVMLYYPLKYEINLLGLLDDDKNFYLPKVNRQNLEVCPYKKGDKLIKSGFNTMEPEKEGVDKKILDLVIVPALMADKNGYRLGYGGGFYDRFTRSGKGNFKTLCAIAKELYVESLPVESFDVKIDEIIYA